MCKNENHFLSLLKMVVWFAETRRPDGDGNSSFRIAAYEDGDASPVAKVNDLTLLHKSVFKQGNLVIPSFVSCQYERRSNGSIEFHSNTATAQRLDPPDEDLPHSVPTDTPSKGKFTKSVVLMLIEPEDVGHITSYQCAMIVGVSETCNFGQARGRKVNSTT